MSADLSDEVLQGNSDSIPTPKRNRGNRRTGRVRGTHSGLRRGTLEWRKDTLILQRIELAERLRASGLTRTEIAARVSAWSAAQGDLDEVSVWTIDADLARSRDLWAERAVGAREDHLAGLANVKRLALDAFAQAPTSSLNRGQYLNVARQAEVDAAKIDGSWQAPPAVMVAGQKIEVVFVGADEWHRRILGVPLDSDPGQEVIDAKPVE